MLCSSCATTGSTLIRPVPGRFSFVLSAYCCQNVGGHAPLATTSAMHSRPVIDAWVTTPEFVQTFSRSIPAATATVHGTTIAAVPHAIWPPEPATG